MESLDTRLAKYESVLKEYVVFAESRRLFNDVFTEGMALLNDYGKGFQFLFLGSKKADLKCPGQMGYYDGLKMRYSCKSFSEDCLSIEYMKSDLSTNLLNHPGSLTNSRDHIPYLIPLGVHLKLIRWRGYEVIEDLEKTTAEDTVLRGKTIFDFGLFRMGPGRSTIKTNQGVLCCYEF